MKRRTLLLLVALAVGCSSPPPPEREVPDPPLSFDHLQSMPPREWVEKPPRIPEQMAIFQVPRARHDPEDGEITVSKGLGGSVEDNLTRWKNQFKLPEGKKIDEVAKVEEIKVAGCPVTYLDVSGTYLHKARPFDPEAKPTPKEEFRMLAVHFQGPRNVYHVVFRGPQKTVAEHKKAFDDWLKGFK